MNEKIYNSQLKVIFLFLLLVIINTNLLINISQ